MNIPKCYAENDNFFKFVKSVQAFKNVLVTLTIKRTDQMTRELESFICCIELCIRFQYAHKPEACARIGCRGI